MLPPTGMLTTKNLRANQLTVIFCALALTLTATGCKPPGAKALLAGKKLYEQGKFADAAEQFRTATVYLPTNALAQNYLGLALQSSSQPTDATSAYQKALALNPNLVEAHYNLGCLYLEQNNNAGAKSEFTAYTLSRPKEFNGWLKLGAAQFRTRDWNNAERSYGEALKINSQSAEAWNAIGLIQVQRGRSRESVQSFNSALKAQPDYAAAILNLAIVQQQALGDRNLALEGYRAYTELKTPPPNLAAVLALVKMLEAELNPPPLNRAPPSPAPPIAAAKPIATNPTPAKPVVVAAKPTPKPEPTPVVTSAKPIETAPVVVANDTPKKVWPEVTPLPPEKNPPVQVVKVADAPPVKVAFDAPTAAPKPQVVQPKPRPVIARYAYHSPLKPKAGKRADAEPFFAQGLDAQSQKQLPEALAAFRAAAKADPSYFKAHYNLAWTAYALKDWPTALEAYENALALDADSAIARYNFALSLKQAGYPLDAANELERMLAKNPNDAAAHFSLGNLYAQQLGAPQLARPHYLRVLDLQPEHPQAQQMRFWLTENP